MNEATDMQRITVDEGGEIRRHRKRLGLSQEEIAYAVGVEQSLVSKVELGKVKSAKTIIKIQTALSSWKAE